MKLIYVLILSLVLVLGFSSTPQSYAENTAVIGPDLTEVFAKEKGPFEVIVSFNGEGAPTNAQTNLLKEIGVETGLTLKNLPIAGVIATKDQIYTLSKNEMVRSIYSNQKLENFNSDATALTGEAPLRAFFSVNSNSVRGYLGT